MMLPPDSLAFAFDGDSSLDEMWRALNANGNLHWRGGDNDFWGEYIHARLSDGHTKLRIFFDDGRRVLDVAHIPEIPGTMPREQALAVVEREVLPLVGARNVQPHSGWG
jgi:hypothetical protein